MPTLRTFSLVLFLAFYCRNGDGRTVTLEELDPARTWRVKKLASIGNEAFSERRLLNEVLTEAGPWYAPWRAAPVFDPVTFEADLKRIKRFYESQGYYQTRVSYQLQVEPKNRLSVLITITENKPVTVAKIAIDLRDHRPERGEAALSELLPLKRGDIFNEEAYQGGEKVLRDFFLGRAHAKVHTERKAKVEVGAGRVFVHYAVRPGLKAAFGQTQIEGAQKVEEPLIRRELSYRPGEPFSVRQIQDSQKNIFNLGLFRSVQVLPLDTAEDAKEIPMRVIVQEQPQRHIKLGVGYATEDEFRGQAAWSRLNWFGGGRQLSAALKLSAINRVADVQFLQPHFFTRNTKARVSLTQAQEDEETYLLDITRLRPRIEHRFTPTVSGFVGYRVEWANLTDIDPATVAELGGVRETGFLLGPSLGLLWDATDDPLDPKQGEVVSLVADQAGAIWGGDFSFFKVTLEGKKYRRIASETVLAARLKIGIADALGEDPDLPLFERFYAGGERGVRGYGRRRLGPISASDDPLGGLSLVEGSIELRRPVWKELSGALFGDFGQVSLDSFDPPFDDLEFSFGAGLAYLTPLGPLRLDIGFPIDPPAGEQAWQIHFSVGQFF